MNLQLIEAYNENEQEANELVINRVLNFTAPTNLIVKRSASNLDDSIGNRFAETTETTDAATSDGLNLVIPTSVIWKIELEK